MDFKQTVGEQIRRVRKLRGMTREQLAEQSGLIFSYINDVERGIRNISLEFRVRLGMEKRAMEGKFNGGRVLGYDNMDKELVTMKMRPSLFAGTKKSRAADHQD
ncbi:helix-turn-helix domain-containing protein [Paenibacillus naphthalenovorans]|uniref:helix-turn-helix domain-containing protein n=1 Tax=Paenibacillus naphthalenovorans TaxID=162209 RepID=UPI0008848F4F|nr:helix-turn-helix transcriptional regulator [Paenibacillus naphthalenovorans]SDJ40173.1 Helix-turn-helix [Paenibacillus naphthalenovorans]